MLKAFLKLYIVLLVILLALPAVLPGQEAKVNKRKIEQEKKRREKAGMKDYEKALKQHHNRQSKETKAMMRHSKKQAKKTLPTGRK